MYQKEAVSKPEAAFFDYSPGQAESPNNNKAHFSLYQGSSQLSGDFLNFTVSIVIENLMPYCTLQIDNSL